VAQNRKMYILLIFQNIDIFSKKDHFVLKDQVSTQETPSTSQGCLRVMIKTKNRG